MAAHVLDQLHRHFGRRRGQSGSSSGSGNAEGGQPPSPKPDPSLSKVRRALFGGGNKEDNLRFAREELAKCRQEASKRWDYDFENDRPIPGGNFVWETRSLTSVGRREMTPYSRPPPGGTTSAPSAGPSVCDNNKDLMKSAVDAVTTASPTILTLKDEVKPSTSQRQSTMTEHFTQRKRSKSKVKTQERRKGSPSPLGGDKLEKSGLETGSKLDQTGLQTGSKLAEPVSVEQSTSEPSSVVSEQVAVANSE